MPLLPGLAVVFVGIAGGGHGKVDQQVKTIVRELHLSAKSLPDASLRALTHHKGATRDIVKQLHTDGVVSFEIIGGHDLRLVTYDGNGEMKTFQEFPLTGGALASDDLGTLKDSIEGDVVAMRHEPAPSQAAAEPEIEMEAPAAKVAPPAPTKTVAKATVAKAIEHKAAPPPVVTTPEPAADAAPEHEAAPTQTADASDSVSAADIEALTSGNADGGSAGNAAELHAAGTGDAPLHIGASVGFGAIGRLFSPGPSSIVGYSSNPVGMVRVDGSVDPTARTHLAIVAETSLGMSTPMQNGSASTSISRWEATAGYTAVRGRVEIAPQLGFGRRVFAIDSADPARTPDGTYNYLIAGVQASVPLGAHLAIKGVTLFEPVVSGAESTDMALGDASRWAVDLGASVELRFAHVFARAGFDWQTFQWSWDMAGARGAGGAVDNYASGSISVGATY